MTNLSKASSLTSALKTFGIMGLALIAFVSRFTPYGRAVLVPFERNLFNYEDASFPSPSLILLLSALLVAVASYLQAKGQPSFEPMPIESERLWPWFWRFHNYGLPKYLRILPWFMCASCGIGIISLMSLFPANHHVVVVPALAGCFLGNAIGSAVRWIRDSHSRTQEHCPNT